VYIALFFLLAAIAMRESTRQNYFETGTQVARVGAKKIWHKTDVGVRR
jgi:hypothetical protein